jgi:hypothetical protein
MPTLGDFATATVIYGKFSTYRPSTGATFTLAGSPVLSVYKTNSTTQSTAGVTLTADFDGVVGLNHFTVDTSADGTFYSAGGFFDLVLTTGTVDGVSVVGAVVASFTLRATSLSAAAMDAIVDLVWDELLTGASHNVTSSAGKRLREITNSVTHSGVAQAGGTATITLASTASTTDGIYDPSVVRISAGTGAGQARLIIQYTGSTRVAAVDRDWRVVPDTSSEYELISTQNIISTNEGIAQGGGTSTITLNAIASSINDAYVGQLVVLRTGTGQDQARIIGAYNGTTKVATVNQAWITNPVAGTGYIMWPLGRSMVTAIVDDAITAASLATNAVDEIVDAVWDEVLTGGTHNIQNSAGKRLREITNSVIHSGTAQAGATASITLASSASTTDGIYDPSVVRISGGTGAGQARMIIQYEGSTRVASVDRDWRVAPDNTSTYEVVATQNIISSNEGLAQGGGASSVTLNADASAVDDCYVGQLIALRTGTGQDQSRIVTAYNGTTKVATVAHAWQVNPAAGTGYVLWPLGRAYVVGMASEFRDAASLANADALLNRDMAAVSDTNARSPLNSLRFLRNKWALSGSTLSVKKEDDSTEAWTATVSTSAGADPVTGSDPA